MVWLNSFSFTLLHLCECAQTYFIYIYVQVRLKWARVMLQDWKYVRRVRGDDGLVQLSIDDWWIKPLRYHEV
jgi:hypothetical protein